MGAALFYHIGELLPEKVKGRKAGDRELCP